MICDVNQSEGDISMDKIGFFKRSSAAAWILVGMLVVALSACGVQAASAPSGEVAPAPSGDQVETVQATPTPALPSEDNAPFEASLITYVIDPAESRASYEVGETFFNQNNRFAIAIGVTQVIDGTVTVDLATPQNSTVSTITIDISQLRSDEPRRDQRIQQEWLESARYPMAIFVPTQIVGLPEAYSPGEEIAFQVTGDFTVREVTRPTTFDVTASIEGDTLRGTATAQILMTDFGFDPPTIAGILGVENEVKLTFEFVAHAQ